MHEYLRWQWLVFLIPLGLSALMALLAAIGVDGHDTDHDHDIDHDAEHDQEADGHHASLLEWVGVGRAPLSVVGLCLLLFFAVIGLAGNLLWGAGRVGLSLLVAAVATPLATRAVARFLGRALPTSESFSVARDELVGCEGTAIYPITAVSGTARLYDRLRTLRQLDCRTASGAAEIPAGATIVVTDYDRERQIFTVQRPEDVFGAPVIIQAKER